MSVVDLHAQVTGAGRPLVVLHGLFGSARNWGSIARGLADIRAVHALDARNHGMSPWAETMAYDEMAADAAAYVGRHQIAPCDLLGHSMGGKTAMLLALSQSDRVGRLIVVDIAPVRYVHEEHATYVEAMRCVDLERATRRANVDQALAPAVPDPALRAFLLQNLVSEQGRLHWRLNLADIGRNLTRLTDFPQVDGRFDGPTLFLAGERSDYIRPRDEAAIRRLFPQARIVEVGQSGHWPHAEQPERFLSLVRQALGNP